MIARNPVSRSKSHRYATSLTSAQRASLKAKAHALKPVVILGSNGLSEAVLKEILTSLERHELIKVQLPSGTDSEEKTLETDELQRRLPQHGHCVGRIGRTVILYLEKDPSEARIPLKP